MSHTEYYTLLPFAAQVQAPPVIPATPSPTAITEVASGETADVVLAAAEQSFSELGLGSHTPVGLIQNLLEFMHVNAGLPWWGAIAACKRNASWTWVKEMGSWGQNFKECSFVRVSGNGCRRLRVRKNMIQMRDEQSYIRALYLYFLKDL